MHHNEDAREEFLEVLGLTRQYLEQRVAAGAPRIELRPGVWESLNDAVARPATSLQPTQGDVASSTPPAPEPETATAPLGSAGSMASDLDRFTVLSELESFAKDCTTCGLCEERQQVVFGVGNPQAKLVFIGEAPGADEDRLGEPFVGRAGQLLTRIIETMLAPWTRADVYICNVIKCRPPDNRDPRPDEIAACEPYLLRQLDLLQPAVIVTLGKFAAQCLLQTNTGMMRMRGSWREYHGIPLMPVVHPAYVLRNQKEGRRMMFDDMKLIRARLADMGVLSE